MKMQMNLEQYLQSIPLYRRREDYESKNRPAFMQQVYIESGKKNVLIDIDVRFDHKTVEY